MDDLSLVARESSNTATMRSFDAISTPMGLVGFLTLFL